MKGSVLFCVIGGVCAALGAADAIDNVGDIKLKGYLGERLDAMIERHVVGNDIGRGRPAGGV